MRCKHVIIWLILLMLFLSQMAFADDGASMKLWDVNINRSYWRSHPEVKHESVQYNPWGNMLDGLEETQADVVGIRFLNHELIPLIEKDALEDLSDSAVISKAVDCMMPWIKKLVVTADGRIAAFPTLAYVRPIYWYQDAWDAAGLQPEDVPRSYTGLLDFLDAWIKRIERTPEKNVCVSRLVRFNTGIEKLNYAAWLMEILLFSHEMQQRYAGEEVTFNTQEFITLAQRTREIGLALYEAEPRQTKRQEMMQLLQSDLQGGEHANNGRPYGMSHTIPLRITDEQPELSYVCVEAVFIRKGSPCSQEGIQMIEDMASNVHWTKGLALYSDFEAGDYPFDSGRMGYVDERWLRDYRDYEGAFVAYPSVFNQKKNASSDKEALVLKFLKKDISAEELAQKLDECSFM